MLRQYVHRTIGFVEVAATRGAFRCLVHPNFTEGVFRLSFDTKLYCAHDRIRMVYQSNKYPAKAS